MRPVGGLPTPASPIDDDDEQEEQEARTIQLMMVTGMLLIG